MSQSRTEPKLTIGVSSCLLGKPVRFDGSHKLDRYITEVLGKVFSFVPVCPEVEIGMGVPRETIDLHGEPETLRLIGNESGLDRTVSMNRWSSQRVRRQDIKQICGFILKSKSPTCGLKSARIVGRAGRSTQRGQGLFASALSQRHESMPVIEESEMGNFDLRRNFIVRLFAYRRIRAALSHRPTLSKLAAFHRKETCLLDAHNRDKRRFMDHLLLQVSSARPSMLREEYVRQFMAALAHRSTIAKNIRVMNGVCRLLTRHTATTDLENCRKLIEAYRRGDCRLIKPLTEFRRCVEKYGVEELSEQSWLFPDEREIHLRFRE